MERLRFVSNGVLAASVALLAFALLTRYDLPVASGESSNMQHEGVIAVACQGSGGASAPSLLWVVDSNKKRMSFYEVKGTEIALRGARNFTYDLEPEQYPSSNDKTSVKNFRDAYAEQYKADPKNKGQSPPEDIMKNAGPGEGAPAKLVVVAGVGPKGSGQENFLYLIETASHRIACYLPDGNRSIKLVCTRSYTYDHQFEYEYPKDDSSGGSVKKLKEAYEEFKKKSDKDKGGDPGTGKGDGK